MTNTVCSDDKLLAKISISQLGDKWISKDNGGSETQDVENMIETLKNRQMSLLCGTGVSLGFYPDKQAPKFLSWTGLIEELFEGRVSKADLTQFRGSSFKELYTNTDIIISSVIQRAMKDNIGLQEQFKKYFSEIIESGMSHNLDWQKYFTKIGEYAKKGSVTPFLVTTNYDNLIAISGNMHLVYKGENGKHIWLNYDPVTKKHSQANKNAAPIHLRRIVENYPSTHLLDELATMHQQQQLEKDGAFVIHLHGYWDDLDSIIFDIVSYNTTLDKSFDSTFKAMWLDRNHSIIFCGVGEGMFDPHFEDVLEKIANEQELPKLDMLYPQISNYWFLKFSEVADTQTKWKKLCERPKMSEHCDVINQTLKIVSFEEFSYIPKFLIWLNEQAILPS